MSNQTSEMEYCETCGTMLVIGECRRCNPVTKIIRSKVVKPSSIPKSEIHTIGVDYVIEKLIDQGISTQFVNERGIDLILNNGKTILVRAMSNNGRLALTNGTLDYLKADYIIVASNLNTKTLRNIQIMTMDKAKEITINKQYRVDGRDDYFIDQSKYIQYKNNYSILKV